MNTNAQKLANEIQSASAGMRAWKLFQALVSMTFHVTAATRHSLFALDEKHINAANEERKKMSKAGIDRNRAEALLTAIADGMSIGYDDFLGDVAAYLGTLEKGLGQFFTPSCAAKLLAQINTQDIAYDDVISRHGYVSVMDPACGSSGLLLRLAEHMSGAGFTPRHELYIEATDIDVLAWKMSYVQLAFRDIPAKVVLGDSLTLDVHDELFTPAYHRIFVPHQRIRTADLLLAA